MKQTEFNDRLVSHSPQILSYSALEKELFLNTVESLNTARSLRKKPHHSHSRPNNCLSLKYDPLSRNYSYYQTPPPV
jgi:hypothetical protein